jgi:hypothetical protein
MLKGSHYGDVPRPDLSRTRGQLCPEKEVRKSGEDGKDGENTVSVSKSYSEFSQGEKLAWRKRKLQVTHRTLTRVL